MTLPSRKQQIEAVAKFLDSDRNEGRSLEEIATEIVDGYHDMLLSAVKKPATPLRPGMLIKSPWDAKVRRVAWLDDGRGEVWIIHETSPYGWLGPLDPPTWEYCEEFRPKKRIDGKMIDMTDVMIEEAWQNADGWKVGDQVSQHQREFIFEIIATGPQCVLMQNVKTGALTADSNACLGKYYRREVKESEDGW